jgi:hypothetical protein
LGRAPDRDAALTEAAGMPQARGGSPHSFRDTGCATIGAAGGGYETAHRTASRLTRIAAFFATLRETAEQLTDLDRWYRILSHALIKYLKGRQLDPPRRLQAA